MVSTMVRGLLPWNRLAVLYHHLDRHRSSELLTTVEDGVRRIDVTAPAICCSTSGYKLLMNDEAVVGVNWHTTEPDRAVTKDKEWLFLLRSRC